MSSRKFAERLRHLGYKVERGNGNKTYVWLMSNSNYIMTKEDENLPF